MTDKFSNDFLKKSEEFVLEDIRQALSRNLINYNVTWHRTDEFVLEDIRRALSSNYYDQTYVNGSTQQHTNTQLALP